MDIESYKVGDIADKWMITPDGYVIERLMPGFRVWKGRRCIEQCDSWRRAVAVVIAERERVDELIAVEVLRGVAS